MDSSRIQSILKVFLFCFGVLAHPIASECAAEDSVLYESAVAPPVRLEAEDDNLSLRLKVKSQEIYLSRADIPAEALRQFENLSFEEQSQFLFHRREILQRFAKILYYPALTLGFFVSWKQKIIRFFKNGEPHGDGKVGQNKEAYINSNLVQENLVKKVEASLWRNVNIVTHTNEYGLHLAIGFVGLTGQMEKGWGRGLSLFINLSYNKAERALAFEMGLDQEKYHLSWPAAMNFALFWRLYPFISYKTESNFSGVETGHAIYPPGLVASLNIDNKFLSLGYSDSPVGFPSVFSSFMYYELDLKRFNLLRLSISYLKITVNSFFGQMWRDSWQSIISVMDLMPKHKGLARQCAQLF